MSLTKSDLMFDYPEELVAVRPQKPPRVLWKQKDKAPQEIAFSDIAQVFREGDLLVINKTQVLPRRLFVGEFDILFLNALDSHTWEVLFPAKKFHVGSQWNLPDGVILTLKQKGRPQVVQTNVELTEEYFAQHGSFALPPYIQQARGERKPLAEDKQWYQTSWAEVPGSLAAPTASLHFSKEDLKALQNKIQIAEVILHVGLGTFLPITAEDLNEHEMHSEFVEIPKHTLMLIEETKARGGRVWALGTTALRALESYPRGHLQKLTTERDATEKVSIAVESTKDSVHGFTNLFLKPGDEFLVCDGLLTNFHQPGSTLICLVSAMAGYKEVMSAYEWAIENKFRLFSYGDLSIWEK